MPNSNMRKTKVRSVYLSPHLDDAALSCGGLIHQQRVLQPLVITCFAGVPDYGVLSPFAAEQHQRWGEPADPIGQRRAEDAAALAPLGAACEHWDYLDCIYRRDPVSGEFLYTSEDALWGAVASAESGLIAELTARLSKALARIGAQPPPNRPRTEHGPEYRRDAVAVYAPLAVGRHVDHQLVLRVALRLRRRGWLVQFYEDYPYAEDPQKLARALRSWASPPEATVVRLSEEDLGAKTAAIRCYASQLAVLFGADSAVAARVQAYALAVGGRQGYAERYWQGGRRR
jgi:LmbE family N-acetylglucosaminyl deacetylase